MNSIVLQLQQDLFSDKCDLLNALRKAHIIAVKLKLSEFDKWISDELNGYTTEHCIPQYRKIRCSLKAFNPYYGWIPAMIPNDDMETVICDRFIPNSISSLIDLYNRDSSSGCTIPFSGEIIQNLNKLFNAPIQMQFALFIDKSCIKEIIEHVKDTLLQWTLKLEEMGILGEDLKFTEKEKAFAKDIPQTVNNYYGTTSVINAPVSNSQIVSGENNNATFNYVLASESVSEIKTVIESAEISLEDKNIALELANEVEDKIKNKKKPSIIKSALAGLKDFVINIGAGTVVAVIEAKMQGLF